MRGDWRLGLGKIVEAQDPKQDKSFWMEILPQHSAYPRELGSKKDCCGCQVWGLFFDRGNRVPCSVEVQTGTGHMGWLREVLAKGYSWSW